MNDNNQFYTVDYITIHGELSHQEKAAYLKRFMAEGEQEYGDIRILLATSGVANAGIDSREIHTISNMIPKKMMYYLDWAGRTKILQRWQ